jgi:hypothetical protein
MRCPAVFSAFSLPKPVDHYAGASVKASWMLVNEAGQFPGRYVSPRT